MEKTRRIRILNLVALIVAVLGLTIAFAALSKTLTINGTANVDAASWDIRFNELGSAQIVGTAKEVSAPLISEDGKSITGINVSVSKPGDSITYEYDIKNFGSIPAKISSVMVNDVNIDTLLDEITPSVLASMYPTCDWDGDGETTDEEREKCFENIRPDFLEFAAFASSIKDDLIIESNETYSKKMIEYQQEAGYVYASKLAVSIKFNGDATELPKGDVIMNMDLKYNFTQSN